MVRPSSSATARKRTARPKKETARSTAAPVSRKDAVANVKRDQLGHLIVEKALYEAGFHGGIATDAETLARYSTDESIFSIRPQIALTPRSVRDVEIAVSVIAKETVRFPALSLTPRGAGTGLSGGSLTDSIVIDVTKHLTYIGELEENRDTYTITCQPGAMWRDVEKKLAASGHYIPSYPASKDICSIGGSIGNNAAGPDSLQYGHFADWIESLDITLYDGNTYTIKPLTYNEYERLSKEQNAYAQIVSRIVSLIEENEAVIQRARPKTRKNTAGYALWDVLDTSVQEWKRGVGTLDLIKLVAGSQGTLGIVTKAKIRVIKRSTDAALVVVPVFKLEQAGAVIEKALAMKPRNVEVFDDLTFDLALKYPQFFRERMSGITYYKAMFALYTTHHIRYGRKTPPFTLLVTLDRSTTTNERLAGFIAELKRMPGSLAKLVTSPHEAEMYWQLRHASFMLSKLEDRSKRPAPFLEDMVVPTEHIAKFFLGIKRLLKKFNVTAAVHGHGGDGHLHFYPLLDFTRKSTPGLIIKMADEFFALALKHEGSLCGEHNDGIIRTPYLSKMFSKNMLTLFAETERVFDPDDIFNPGKKVNPRFDIKSSIRTTN